MNYREVMSELEKMGTEQNRKIYARHAMLDKIDPAKLYGVSYANLGKLQKKIKVDHDLALELWDSGNHDARILATLIADPEKLDDETAEAWVNDLGNYIITDAFTEVIARSSMVQRKMEEWTKSKEEFVGQCGWGLLGRVSHRNPDLPDSYFEDYLETIETNIHKSKNRVRHSMNGALISIALRNPRLEKMAVAAVKRIGKVEVDHGDTSCKTPDALEYIEKAKAYRAKKGKKAKK